MSGVFISKIALATALAGYKQEFKKEFEAWESIPKDNNFDYQMSICSTVDIYERLLKFLHSSVENILLDCRDFSTLYPYLKEW